jgi:hypothetical protein
MRPMGDQLLGNVLMQYQLDYAIDTLSRQEILKYLELSTSVPGSIQGNDTETLREILRKEVERGTIDVTY